ncbi:hypothetical protein BPORC_1732 [Bifidobacterium porcinum]|nr:hypothetical protein BPORC_1732 [Bifidobacterium porcinum]
MAESPRSWIVGCIRQRDGAFMTESSRQSDCRLHPQACPAHSAQAEVDCADDGCTRRCAGVFCSGRADCAGDGRIRKRVGGTGLGPTDDPTRPPIGLPMRRCQPAARAPTIELADSRRRDASVTACVIIDVKRLT